MRTINDVGAGRDRFVVYVHFGPEVPSHGGVRLGYSESLPYDCVEDGSLRFPDFERNFCETCGEARRGRVRIRR
jgi:hypothetical protein